MTGKCDPASNIDLESVPMDPVLWQASVKALAGTLESEPSANPASCIRLCSTLSCTTMRSDARVLHHYLTHGLKIAPVSQTISGSAFSRIFFHGDLEVDGDFEFWRKDGAPISCVVTGDLRVRGSVHGSAFDSELMVGGNLHCESLSSDAELAVGGTITTRYARLCWYDCSYACEKLTAEVLIDHAMQLEGTTDVRLLVECEDHSTDLTEAARQVLERALLPELVDQVFASGDEEQAYKTLDRLIHERLLADKPFFRNDYR